MSRVLIPAAVSWGSGEGRAFRRGLGLWLGVCALLAACGYATSSPPSDLPSLPWPPPASSSRTELPPELLLGTGATLLGDVDRRIRGALEQNGYFESSYWAVPGGYALVTRMESIEADGRPKPEAERWQIGGAISRPATLREYLASLFRGRPGYYRLIVFVLTPRLFAESDAQLGAEEAQAWLHRGGNGLPAELAAKDFPGDGFICTALIYEFLCETEGGQARLLADGRLSSRTHLDKSGIWEALRTWR